MNEEPFLRKIIGIHMFCPMMLDPTMESKGLKAFLNETSSKFDMVITETFSCQEPFIALGYKYGAVQVTVQTVSVFSSLARATGNPHNPAYVPSAIFPTSDRMNFWQRSKNTLVTLLEHIKTQAAWIYMVLFLNMYLYKLL